MPTFKRMERVGKVYRMKEWGEINSVVPDKTVVKEDETEEVRRTEATYKVGETFITIRPKGKYPDTIRDKSNEIEWGVWIRVQNDQFPELLQTFESPESAVNYVEKRISNAI